ncbi:hypothetical protein AMK06_CH02294 [Rhizobium sp. N541]|uniref:HEPN domain-containing protein n=1 Tax=unclassified Rhizobium TaxID=2613769 RepID=UPI0007EE2C42|nr:MULTISPECIES: HEPN domain-containing protein [unclassified Rhizobium]ANM17188.1 hypothetical protein AMK06_CH02294 [Rhizobium sp. N541]ANM23573.1 hypothetical protein AMK07_CH02291 [Rhizobium sp. N941]
MRFDTTFLCGLDQIELPAMPQRGERFADNYYLTRDKQRIAELISEFGGGLGNVETSYLVKRASAVVYRRSQIEFDGEDAVACLEKSIIDDMLAVKRLEMGLWLVKDNAAHFDRAWIVARTAQGSVVHTNTWASRASAADGTFDPVSYSLEELRLARNFNTPLPAYLRASGSPTMLTKGSLRFQRFQYFLSGARQSIDVAMKIAEYCSGLEALVSNSQQELSHQVSERVAALLAPPGPDRISNFKLVRQAYGYRSKAVHGASFKPADVTQLRDCSKKIDQFCRSLFELYLEEEGQFRTAVEGPDDDVTQFFIELLLGAPKTSVANAAGGAQSADTG